MAKFQVMPIKTPKPYTKTEAPVNDYWIDAFGYWKSIAYVIEVDEEVVLLRKAQEK